MIKVITYGTYDLLHAGHIRLLERAKALGDYLIVGVTADSYDLNRGKINVVQSLATRIENIKKLNIADEIIVEEYDGQKIDDIIKYNVDIFAIGSDWRGHFDYLNKYCKVVYLERTKGISSSYLRSINVIKMAIIGDNYSIVKYIEQAQYINGLIISCVYTKNRVVKKKLNNKVNFIDDINEIYQEDIDAMYIQFCDKKLDLIKRNMELGIHTLYEMPILNISKKEFLELKKSAYDKGIILMESIKTAYSLAYHRLILLINTGIIGDVINVSVSCTSLEKDSNVITKWGATALLPIIQILGSSINETRFYIKKSNDNITYVNGEILFPAAKGSFIISSSYKHEGLLIVSGSKGCIVVPSPWWKTDYFEIHYENSNDNKRVYYSLDGEGIKNLLLMFFRNILGQKNISNIDEDTSIEINNILNNINCNMNCQILGDD